MVTFRLAQAARGKCFRMRQKKQKYICIVMAALLLLCLLPMSYGFDVLARFLAMAAFAYLAYLEYQNKNTD